MGSKLEKANFKVFSWFSNSHLLILNENEVVECFAYCSKDEGAFIINVYGTQNLINVWIRK